MHSHNKAQAAIELLIILAIAIIILTVIISYSNTTVVDLQKQKEMKTAEKSVLDLKQAAEEVYLQGAGAKKKVYYEIPAGVSATDSGISGNSFVINVYESDVYALADVNLQGSISTDKGGHFVWLTAYAGYVNVGVENVSADKQSLYLALDQNSSASDTITVTNEGTETATVTIVESWSHSDMNLTLSTSSFSLNAGESQTVTLDFNSGETAIGTYSGNIKVNSSFASASDENITIPLSAEIIIQPTVLAVFSTDWTESINIGATRTQDFNICNLGDNDLSDVNFAASGGEPGNYIQAVSNINNLSAYSCVPVTITMDASGGSAGSHTGTITVQNDNGSGSYIETIYLNTTVTTPVYAMLAPASGTDTTNTSNHQTLDASELAEVAASDDDSYRTFTNWGKNDVGYEENKYIEYVFSASVPGGAVIDDINVVHEFALSNASAVGINAKLEIWDGNTWTDEILMVAQEMTDVDITNTVTEVESYIDTPAKVNSLKIRFLAYVVENANRKSDTDLISVGVAYHE